MRLQAALAMLALAACTHVSPSDPLDRSGFVDAAQAVSGLAVEMKYFSDDNFVGRPIAGYEAPICLLTTEAAAALSQAQASAGAFGLGLKVFDCYRPRRAVADFVMWAKNLSDQTRKTVQYPNVDKSRLFELGYIAERSGHSRGSTLDLTLIDLATGAELNMGSGYDLFDTLSWPSDPRPGPQARANRMLLQTLMTGAGFRPLKEEWWHFTLNGEPYPETYFDFAVK
ncbi:MAG: M15 family metallopeptidase [Hyphomonadaceae bacterium]